MRRLAFRSNQSLLAAALAVLLVSCFVFSGASVPSALARVDPRPLDLGDPTDYQAYQAGEKSAATCPLRDACADPFSLEEGALSQDEPPAESPSSDDFGRAARVLPEVKWLLAARLILFSLGIGL